MRTIGSQERETLQKSGMMLSVLRGKSPHREAILVDKETKGKELWTENDHASGHVIEIKDQGFEFARGV